jgi:hypothetical protein
VTPTTMTQDARPSGASTKLRVFGDQKQAPGDPFLAPFFEAAVEHVWGGVWNRPGLELKYRSLVVVSVLAGRDRWQIAAGENLPDRRRTETEPRTFFPGRGCLAAGTEEIR